MLESCVTHFVNHSAAYCNSFFANNTPSSGGESWNGSAKYRSNSSSSMDITTFIEAYIISFLIVIGVGGNVLSVVVLRKDKERKDALFLLQALAMADLMYLLAAALRYPFKHFLPTHEQYIDMQPIVFPLLKTLQTITIWMMVLVAIDRYVCVCRSLEAPGIFNQTTRRRYALIVFCMGFIYNMPRFFDSHTCRWYEPCTGRVLSRMLYRQVFANSHYWNIYLDGMYLLLLYVAPLTTLGFFNFRLVEAIRYSSRKRYRMNSRLSSATRTTWSSGAGQITGSSPGNVSGSDKNATMVLITIVIVFIVCETPELIIKFMSFTERNFAPSLISSTQLLRFNIVSELLMVINSTINFVVYLVYGRRFRRILRETFRFSFHFSSSSTTTTTDDLAPRHHNCIHAPTARLHRV